MSAHGRFFQAQIQWRSWFYASFPLFLRDSARRAARILLAQKQKTFYPQINADSRRLKARVGQVFRPTALTVHSRLVQSSITRVERFSIVVFNLFNLRKSADDLVLVFSKKILWKQEASERVSDSRKIWASADCGARHRVSSDLWNRGVGSTNDIKEGETEHG